MVRASISFISPVDRLLCHLRSSSDHLRRHLDLQVSLLSFHFSFISNFIVFVQGQWRDANFSPDLKLLVGTPPKKSSLRPSPLLKIQWDWSGVTSYRYGPVERESEGCRCAAGALPRSKLMNSPDRSLFTATPLPKFEDSPFFNFLNTMSPIQPVKSVHRLHAYTSPGFSSVSLVFSSPHISLPRKSRFLIRPSYLETSKQDNPSKDGVPNYGYGNCTIKCLLNEAAVDPPDDCLALTSRVPKLMQYDCGSPDPNIAPCYGIKLDLNLNVGSTEETRKSLFAERKQCGRI